LLLQGEQGRLLLRAVRRLRRILLLTSAELRLRGLLREQEYPCQGQQGRDDTTPHPGKHGRTSTSCTGRGRRAASQDRGGRDWPVCRKALLPCSTGFPARTGPGFFTTLCAR